MFVVYEVESGCMSLMISSCGEDKDSPIDHLHFDLKVSCSLYKEVIEGVIYVCKTDTVVSLIERCLEVYANETLTVLKDEVKRGFATIQ